MDSKQEQVTLQDIRRAMPKKYFECNTLTSISYFLVNLALSLVLLLVAIYYFESLSSPFFEIAWLSYFFLQGKCFWGFFLLGHDCGHKAFSKNRLINDGVGLLVHSFLLLPYEQWKFTHRNHHRYCGHIDKDEGYGPVREGSKVSRKASALLALSGFAYWCYLVGISRHGINHYSYTDSLFKSRKSKMKTSLFAVMCMFLFLAVLSFQYGVVNVLLYYVIPLQVYSYYFIIITFLQHNDEKLVWHSDKEWTPLKGSLTTIDRNISWWNIFCHHINLHQVHHFYPNIPHYRLAPATKVFRKNLPLLVNTASEATLFSYAKNLWNYTFFGKVKNNQHRFSYHSAKHSSLESNATSESPHNVKS